MAKIFGVHTTPNYFKNYLINSNFDFSQRASSSTILANNGGYSTLDRWRTGYNGSGAGPTLSQNSSSTPNSDSFFNMQFASAADSNTTNWLFSQRIESGLARELAGLTVSLGVWLKSSVSGMTVNLSYLIPSSTDNYTSTASTSVATVTVTNTWAYYTFPAFTLPSTTTNGISMLFTTSNFNPGGVSQTLNIAQAMLNIGPQVAAYRMHGETLDQELIACQRYYEANSVNPLGSVNNGTHHWAGYANTTTNAISSVYFLVQKRTVPTITQDSTVGNWRVFSSIGSQAPSSLNSPGAIDINAFWLNFNVASAMTSSTPAIIYYTNGSGFAWTASAEI